MHENAKEAAHQVAVAELRRQLPLYTPAPFRGYGVGTLDKRVRLYEIDANNPGRIPNTTGVGLEQAGIELDNSGFVRVNERLETTASNVWAMGDCAGSPFFTHVAYDDFRIVGDNLNGGNRTTRNRLVPFCMFTDPELVRVGINESEAKARRVEYRLVKIPMSSVLRMRTLSERRGFMKMLIEAESDRILGFTAFGTEASELMAAVQTAMLGDLPNTVLRDAIFTHPTTAEGLEVLMRSVPARQAQKAA